MSARRVITAGDARACLLEIEAWFRIMERRDLTEAEAVEVAKLSRAVAARAEFEMGPLNVVRVRSKG